MSPDLEWRRGLAARPQDHSAQIPVGLTCARRPPPRFTARTDKSVIAYIDRSFGAERVVYFLRTLHSAQSLPQAIEAALPISYASFEQQWQQWLEARLRA